jgi:predicted DNA-binding mobile mystery protein A
MMLSPPSARGLTPEMRALQRRQLDGWLSALPVLDPPRAGWLRTIRDALGMSLAQLGRRLGISPQSVLSLEQRELEDTISVGKLREAAHAMGCELRVVFIPRTSLEETVREQATRRARAERQRLLHTMRLEAQEDGVAAVLDEQRAIDAWMTTRARRLWD